MKKLITILLLFIAGLSYGQLYVPAGNTIFTTNNGEITSKENVENNGTIYSVELNGGSAQSISGTGSMRYLKANNNSDISLSSSHSITNNGITLTSGKIILGNYNLTTVSVTNDGATRYIKTSGSGVLRMNATTGAYTKFPIGNTTYNYVRIYNNNAAADTFSVRVQDTLYSNPGNSTGSLNNSVNRTWTLSKTAANSGTGVNIEFNWNSGDVKGTLTNAVLYEYNGTKWVKANGTQSVSGNQITVTGYTGTLSSKQFMVSSSLGATVTAAASACQNTSGINATFTGSGGTAPYTFTYTLNGGSNQTVTTTSGSNVTVSVSTTAAGNQVFALVNVSDANLQNAVTDSATINIKATSTSTQSATACDSYFWNGTTYTTSGAKTWTGTNAAGCDSVVTLNLTINTTPATPTVNVVNNCDGTSTLSTTASGSLLWSTTATTSSITVSSAGSYTVTTTVNGCTSAQGSGTAAPKTTPATPTVNVVNNCDGTSTLSTTASGSLLWSTTATTSSITVSSAGSYTVTTTVNGCVSLSGSGVAAPKASNTGDTSASACGSFVWYGVTYNASATTTHRFTNAAGCDSVVTLHLTINNAKNWIGGNGNWSNSTNWCGGLPASSDDITITTGTPTLDVDFAVAGSLTISGTGGLVINPNKTISIASTGTVDFGGKSVTFKSTAAGTASLGKVQGTLNGATNVTVERYIPQNIKRAWRLLSVPTKGTQTINAAWQEGQAGLTNNNPGYGTLISCGSTGTALQGFDFASNTASVQSYNSGLQRWDYLTATNNSPMETLKGYFLFVRGDRTQTAAPSVITNNATATTLRTTGTLYQGNTTPITVGANKYEVVGNVYVSAIDWTKITKTNVNLSYYLWDSKAASIYQGGAFQTFSPLNNYKPLMAGSYGAGTVADPFVSNVIIESGAAMFVTSTTGGSISLTEDAKVSSGGRNSFRPSAQMNAIPKLNTSLYSVVHGDSKIIDANMVAFDASFENETDEMDVPKMMNNGENLGIAHNGQKLAIDARKPLEATSEVVFDINNIKAQTYHLEFKPSNLNIEGLTAQLKDNYLHTYTTIDLNNASQTYSFTVNNEAASKASDRFKVVFTKAPAIIKTPSFVVSPNPVEGGEINIQFKNQLSGKYTARLLSAAGQLIKLTTIAHAGGSSVDLMQLPAMLASGTYQLEITSPEKVKTVVQLVVNKK